MKENFFTVGFFLIESKDLYELNNFWSVSELNKISQRTNEYPVVYNISLLISLTSFILFIKFKFNNWEIIKGNCKDIIRIKVLYILQKLYTNNNGIANCK